LEKIKRENRPIKPTSESVRQKEKQIPKSLKRELSASLDTLFAKSSRELNDSPSPMRTLEEKRRKNKKEA